METTKVFGNRAAWKESAYVALIMLVVTSAYEYGMSLVIADFSVNWFEFVGTWFVLNAVWLVRTQNILNWLWGIAGVIALGFFFREIGLPGQQWLQWAYFVPVQVWSWYYWVQGATGDNELPVTRLTARQALGWVLTLGVGSGVLFTMIDVLVPSSQYPLLDAVVVTASVIAQYLMGQKKMESWVLWLGPVNLLSVVLFFLAGAYVLTALYVAFFVHAVFGVRSWYRASRSS